MKVDRYRYMYMCYCSDLNGGCEHCCVQSTHTNSCHQQEHRQNIYDIAHNTAISISYSNSDIVKAVYLLIPSLIINYLTEVHKLDISTVQRCLCIHMEWKVKPLYA